MNLENKKILSLDTQNGFSLIEILIALTLLALAGTFVMGKVFDSLHEGKEKSTHIQMSALSDRLKEFRRHCGFYPTTEQGLEALVTKPVGGRECTRYAPNGYLEAVPKDPWDSDYLYESDGKDFNIISYGNDKAEGGTGEDADISFKDKSAGKGKAAPGTESADSAPADNSDGANN